MQVIPHIISKWPPTRLSAGRFASVRNRNAASRTGRRGITLLEILFSLAVAVIGMFGIFVLIPVSARLAQVGLDFDASGSLGRSSLEQFEVRGMRAPNTWAGMNPRSANLDVVNVIANESYCIDPEFFARNVAIMTPASFNTTGAWFPTNTSAALTAPTATQPRFLTPAPSMRRISLASGSPFAPVMTEAMAEQIFSSFDDLQFTEPVDKSFAPVQHYHGEELFDPAAPDFSVLSKRQSLKQMSWIAQLTPRPSATLLPESDLYTLYVVVFSQRDPNISAQIDLGTGALIGESERWCEVTFDTGLGGGEALIQSTIDFNLGSGTERDIDVARNEWMLVCQRLRWTRVDPATAQPLEQVYDLFRWYRIADVDEVSLNTANIPERYVTLDGPDWFTSAATVAPGVTFEKVYGVTVKGVMEVYERTVRLEQRSIWSQ